MKISSTYKIKINDSLNLNGQWLIVEELFRASAINWVRVTDKKQNNKYFTYHEWYVMYLKANRYKK